MRISEVHHLGPDWYKDGTFWNLYAPYIFAEDRWGKSFSETKDIAALMNLSGDARILDACCGVGRHSLELAKMGFRVTGVDLNEAFLDAARASAEAEEVHIDFVEEDILTFREECQFDAAINMYTSFGYFETEEEEIRFLRNIRYSLKKGGLFLIETLGKEILARNFKESEWYEKDGSYILAKYRIIDDWNRLENRWIILSPEARYDYRFSHRIFSGKEMRDLLTEAGFSSVRLFGNLTGDAYDHTAETLVALAKT